MIPNIYQGNYNRLAILPILLLVAAAFFIPQIKLGVDFTGGTLIVLELNSPVDAEQLRLSLENEGIIGTVKTYTTPFGEKAEIEIGQNPDLAQADTLRDQFNAQIQNVSILEAESAYNSSYLPEYLEERAKLNNISNSLFLLAGETANASSYDNLNILSSDSLSAYRQVYDNYKNIISKSLNKYADFSSFSIETVTPALGAHFIDRALGVVIWVALLSIIFVFLFFRSLIPSIAVIIGAFCDIFISLGAMGLFGIPLTLASFAALLMLLGFSLDTDVLLTMRLLKRKGEPRENAFDALKTGVTMSVTAIFAFFILFLIGSYTHISIYSQISSVALAGLVGDIFATWGINAVLLLNHKEGKI